MAKSKQEIKRIINSVSNEEIRQVAKLNNPKNRLEQKRFIAEGIRVCTTFVASGYKPVYLYVTQHEHADSFAGLVDPAIITLVNDRVMNKMSPSVTPSGTLCVFTIPDNPPTDILGDGIVLAQISDPGNMGTLIRTAASMKAKSVVIIEGTDPWNPKVVQASAGCMALVNIFCIDWQTLVQAKKQQKLKLIGLVVAGGKQPGALSYKNSLLVVGSEAHGIPSAWIDDCDETMTLPMPGKTESLNAAVAGSIALYLAYTM